MATSTQQFQVELYQEHLDEASFLYEQRLVYLHDPEVNWSDLGDWEERFEAHIDALVVGGELALDVCRQQAADGDAGEMHAALRVFCRQNQKDDAFAVLDALDPTDEEAVRAAAQALCCETPTSWRDDLQRAFQGDQPQLTPVMARVIGYRRLPSEELLKSKLTARPSFGSADSAWALGRVGSAESWPVLRPLLDSNDELVCEAAAIALLRLGDDQPLQRAMLAAPARPWARRVLGIGGNSASVRMLLDVLKGQSADEAAVVALGLLGDLGAVAPLVDLLDDDDLSEPAAVALNTITGAGLYTDVFLQDEFDPDELLDEEREAYERDGTVPTRDDGQPLGDWEHRPLLEKAEWRAWLDQNKQRFSREHCWRMGTPYGPMALFECLRSETSPYSVRVATYEELVVRYGLDVPFEVELRVSQQVRFLRKIEDWVTLQSGKFTSGRRYFAGRVQG